MSEKQKTRREPQGDVAVETQHEKKLKKPPLYRVMLHNDDFTPMEFVVAVLRTVFHKSENEAVAIMLHAHTRGMAVAGVYTFEVAEEKVKLTAHMAREHEYPLLATMEPED